MKKYYLLFIILFLFIVFFTFKEVVSNKQTQFPDEICNTCYTPDELVLNEVSLVHTGFLKSDKGQLYFGDLGTKQVINSVSVYFLNDRIYTFSEIKSESKHPYTYIEWATKPVK